MLQAPSPDALLAADRIVSVLMSQHHGDYSAYRDEIAQVLYEDGLWSGNWDASREPPSPGTLPPLRLIEENEYDQSMPDDEKPAWATMIGQVRGGYLFFL